jgi:threonyl-tRNA synthetase
MLIVGDKEVDTSTVSVRLKNGANIGIMNIEELADRIHKEAKDY